MSVVLQNNNNLVVSKQKPLYNRPSDWLTLSDLNESEEKFVGLYGVFNGDSNYVTIQVQGNYTVDWGDGTIENFNSNALVEHRFVYGDISNSTLTSDGYKQVIITITPQNNQHITYINFQNTPTIYSGNGLTSTWLEMKMSLNYISEFYFSSQNNNRHRFLKAFIWQGSEDFIFTSLSYFFNECVDLEYVKFFNCSSGNYNQIFNDCRSIKTIEGNFTFTTLTSFSNVFRNCYTLQKLPNIILNSGVSTGTFLNAFQNCYNLTNLDLSYLSLSAPFTQLSISSTRSLFDPPKINFSGFSQIVFTFSSSGIQYLTSDYVFGNISWNSLFTSTFNLMTLPSFNVSGITSYSNTFNNSFGNLLKCQIFNINSSINFSNKRLGRNEIVEIFNNLTDRTSTTSSNISITGCYGAFYLTAADRLIATNKNWTITG